MRRRRRHREQTLIPEVKRVVAKGTLLVYVPIFLIYVIVLGGGSVLISRLVDGLLLLLALLTFPAAFILSWWWWSLVVPRWREWALSQPGIDPNELQRAAEAAGLVWPKSHRFGRRASGLSKRVPRGGA